MDGVCMDDNSFKLTDEIISNARKNMNKLVDSIISLKMEEIETYEFPQDQPFGLEIIKNNALFYLIIKFSSTNKNFICMNPGAFERDRCTSDGELIEPPYFSRWSWYRYFDESVIITADPMIFRDKDMKIGWMIGEKDQWYVETLSIIIKKLAINQNVLADNILFFGSSGGGFISLCLAILTRNSKILVNNSQLSIPRYSEIFLDKSLDSVLPTFEGMTKKEIIEQYSHRLDLIELIKKEDYAPHITYYVNAKSNPDIKKQALPFIREHLAQEQHKELDVIFYSEEKEKTHNPLPNKETIEIIKSYAKNNLYNLKPDSEDRIIYGNNYESTLEKTIEKLKKSNEKLKKENKNLNKENKNLKNKISEMETSHSWKITKPLRKMNNIRK